MALLTRCQLICVEGNISAGKSTLCKELAERLDYELFLEPVLTNPYIERYYADVSIAAPTPAGVCGVREERVASACVVVCSVPVCLRWALRGLLLFDYTSGVPLP